MQKFTYIAVLAGCALAALWLEPVLKVGVLRQRRRLLATLAVVAIAFVAWVLAAVAAGHWSYDAGQVVGVWLPGGLPIEEVAFFLVVPFCAILTFEAVRSVLARVDQRAARPRQPNHRDGGIEGP
jgi:lycopene cyclase domain-containing protein